MAIQPIDLQNMYSQISNVAKNVGAQQNAMAMSDISQQQKLIQENNDNLHKVQQTNKDSNTNTVNANGHNKQEQQEKQNQKKDNPSEITLNAENVKPAREKYLGTIIDITR